MEERICKQCKHFRQHFVLDSQVCVAINCGHCVYPQIKHRQAKRKACEYFAEREVPLNYPDRAEVLHFLTTELLRYVLTLELPPEIVDM